MAIFQVTYAHHELKPLAEPRKFGEIATFQQNAVVRVQTNSTPRRHKQFILNENFNRLYCQRRIKSSGAAPYILANVQFGGAAILILAHLRYSDLPSKRPEWLTFSICNDLKVFSNLAPQKASDCSNIKPLNFCTCHFHFVTKRR